MSAQDIFATALALPARERARLAHELIASLDADADPDAEMLALNETLRRSDEIDRGVVRPIPLNDAVEASLAEIGRRAREVEDGSAALEEWSTVRDRLAARRRARRTL